MPEQEELSTPQDGIAQKHPLQVQIVTIFPDFFASSLAVGVVSRALKRGLASVSTVDLRSFTLDRHRTVDDRPFGGGEGMVLKPEPLATAMESLGVAPKAKRNLSCESVVLLSAQGKRFTQTVAHEMAQLERIVLLCGRYEGVDERVNELYCDRELSIGDYVLSGGELGAAVIVDAVIRLLPGVLGNADSVHNESFGQAHAAPRSVDDSPPSTSAAGGVLDYPHYTRPANFQGIAIPEVLAAGDHLAIQRWRRQAALRKTLQNRPDLLETAELSGADRKFLALLQDELGDAS